MEFLSLDSPHGFHKGEIRIEPARFAARKTTASISPSNEPIRIRCSSCIPPARIATNCTIAPRSNRSPKRAFVLEPLAVEQAANQALSKYAFVVLSDVGAMPAGLENSLRAYVNGGGSLLVALGPLSAALTHVPVSGETIQGSSYASLSGSRFETVASADAEHPSAAPRQQAGWRQVLSGDQASIPGQSHVIARLTNQAPLLLEKQIGEGRVMVFTSTFDNIGNDLPLHASFVPFVEETARYLGGQQDRSTNVAVDSYIELRSAKERGAAIDVIEPDGTHPLSLKDATTAQTFQVTREGFYDIHRANGRQEMVAVHADRRESDLTPIPQETLDAVEEHRPWPRRSRPATPRPPTISPAPGACGATLCYWS